MLIPWYMLPQELNTTIKVCHLLSYKNSRVFILSVKDNINIFVMKNYNYSNIETYFAVLYLQTVGYNNIEQF